MRVAVLAVGRPKSGPEAALVADWLGRAEAAGRPLGLGPFRLVEVEARRRRGSDGEAELLLAALPPGATLVALDERGAALDSPAFAARIAGWRDGGVRDLAFAVGGADGHGAALRARADLTLSFGPMVWPHLLARAMLAEQLWRAVSILSGGPYHRA